MTALEPRAQWLETYGARRWGGNREVRPIIIQATGNGSPLISGRRTVRFGGPPDTPI